MSNDLKQKTSALRRQHILEAAVHVFEAHGFRGATIKDIAKQAGISDGTVYNVFENKEALLLAILEPMLRDHQVADQSAPKASANLDIAHLFQTMIANRWQSQTPEMLAMMRIILSESLINRELATKYLSTIIAPTLNDPIELFEKLLSTGAIASTDIHMTLRIIVSSFLGLALLRLLGEPISEEQASKTPEHLANLLLNGLLPRQPKENDHAAF